MISYPKNTKTIISFGSCNKENLLFSESDISLGNKYSVVMKENLGGSGVNYTLRLLSTGYNVIPILPVGDDQIGNEIRNRLLITASKYSVSSIVTDFIGSDNFFDLKIKTSSSTIIVHGLKRTVFSQKPIGCEHYKNHIKKCISLLNKSLTEYPNLVIIGHIYCDSGEYMNSLGECTKMIIDTYKKNSLIYTNFGNSQIHLGIKFWEKELPNIDVFQLNFNEIIHFFAETNLKRSLINIIQWLIDRKITSVITLGKLGAIGIFKNQKEKIILSCPVIDNDLFLDKTGAGDAFAAGMISQLYDKPHFTFHDFYCAIEMANIWSAYTCTTLGASSDCPDQKALNKFITKIPKQLIKPIEINFKMHGMQIIKLIENAFQDDV
jgi:sugar/nucleoside kinase (ribokinase family)